MRNFRFCFRHGKTKRLRERDKKLRKGNLNRSHHTRGFVSAWGKYLAGRRANNPSATIQRHPQSSRPGPRDDTRWWQAMVWGTAGRDRNGPARRTRDGLTDSKPVEPRLAQAGTRLGNREQPNQKQTHTQQAEKSHAVCLFQSSPSFKGKALPRQTFPCDPAGDRHFMARWNQ
jgi:hypothetical protein